MMLFDGDTDGKCLSSQTVTSGLGDIKITKKRSGNLSRIKHQDQIEDMAKLNKQQGKVDINLSKHTTSALYGS